MIEVVLAITAGILDRIRGGYPEGRPGWVGRIARWGIGACVVHIVSPGSWWLMLAGMAITGEWSWRQDNGWRGDWVRGEGTWWHPLFWGVLWCIPFGLFGFTDLNFLWVFLCVPIGALAGIWISTKLPPVPELELRHAWPWSELIEMPIALGLLALIVNIV